MQLLFILFINLNHVLNNAFLLGTPPVKRVTNFMIWRHKKFLLVEMSNFTKLHFLQFLLNLILVSFYQIFRMMPQIACFSLTIIISTLHNQPPSPRHAHIPLTENNETQGIDFEHLQSRLIETSPETTPSSNKPNFSPTPHTDSLASPKPPIRQSTHPKQPSTWYKDYILSAQAKHSTSTPSSASGTRYPLSHFFSYSCLSFAHYTFLANVTSYLMLKLSLIHIGKMWCKLN